jgi:pimeloyl-ACP methyl ester carboxylesterase
MTDLVLLPGMLCDRALWANQIAAFDSGAGGARAQIIVGDLTRSDSIAGMATDVLVAAPERFALAGMSMGGFVALEIMRQAPERVLRLALLDTSARVDTPEQADGRRLMMRQARDAGRGVGAFKGMTVRQLPRWVHPEHMQDANLVATVTAMTARVGREAFMRQQQAALDRRDSRPHLAAIVCPTLVLCGREDQATPVAHHEEMAAAIPDAQLVVVERCGHLSPLEQPPAVNAAMAQWLGWGGGLADRD